METEDELLVEERATADGHRIGFLTLNRPIFINAISLDMLRRIHQQLDAWAADPGVVLAVLSGAGERGFSAGGDVHALYASMRESPPGDPLANAYAQEFFEVEYRLNFALHTYEMPILAWANGIVMGGGLGLVAGVSHRVATETTQMAMPECAIGLFPDVGGTWFLPRLSARIGWFLGLTGARLGASDAVFAGMADYEVPNAAFEPVLQAAIDATWTRTAEQDRALLTDILRDVERPGPEGPLQRNIARVRDVSRAQTLDQFAAGIASITETDDDWLRNAGQAFGRGAPSAIAISWKALARAQHLSLAEALRAEYLLALRVAAHGDFAEGARAMLVEMDRNPRWSPSMLAEVSGGWADAFFERLWAPGDHPLANLGA